MQTIRLRLLTHAEECRQKSGCPGACQPKSRAVPEEIWRGYSEVAYVEWAEPQEIQVSRLCRYQDLCKTFPLAKDGKSRQLDVDRVIPLGGVRLGSHSGPHFRTTGSLQSGEGTRGLGRLEWASVQSSSFIYAARRSRCNLTWWS